MWRSDGTSKVLKLTHIQCFCVPCVLTKPLCLLISRPTVASTSPTLLVLDERCTIEGERMFCQGIEAFHCHLLFVQSTCCLWLLMIA